MNSSLEYYKFIANSVQFKKAELVSMNCEKNDISEDSKGKELGVNLAFQRETRLIKDATVEVILHTYLSVPNDLFKFEIIYKGICIKLDPKISETAFEQYAYDQVVPLLLPYVREIVSSTMARMNLPIFTIPTMDVLDSIEANLSKDE